jgi:diguanylate cyclase (GGDEF)-like protein
VSDVEQIIARPLRALRLDSIRHEILVFAVLAGILPALATVVQYTRIKESLTGQVGQELRVASSETARGMDEWLDERLYDIRASATSYMLSENLVKVQISGTGPALTRIREYLSSMRRRFPDDEGLLVSDSRGHGVTGSGRVTGMQLTPDDLNGLRTGESVVGDAWWDAGLAKAVIVLAVPINDADGRFVGALSAKVNLRSVTELLQRLTPAAGGDLYLMTDQGRLIVKARASSAELMRSQIPADALQVLSEKEGMTVLYQRADGQEIVGTLRHIPKLRWAAVAELPRAEAFRTVAQLRRLTAFTLIALFAGVALITYMLGMLIVRPLARLTSAAAKVATGDLNVELPVGGSGEVGYLSQAFANLVARLRERESQADLERLSITDALTGLYNRRHLMGTLASEVQRTRRLRRGFSVLLVDVDRFKQYNDTYGHLAGDTALVKIADILRKATRGVDCVARYGGEEFLVLLLEATISTAGVVAERIRSRVAEESFDGGSVTVSIGIAECPSHGDTAEDLIASADAAMYQAKSDGRNRVVSADAMSQEAAVPAGRRPRKGPA